MRNIKIVFLLGFLFLGLTVTASAQRGYGQRERSVYGYPNGRQTYQRRVPRNVYRRNNRERYYDRSNDRYRYNRGNDYWNNNRRYQYNRPYYGNRKRTFRTPSGRLVTILPNGRRIIH